MAYEWGHKECNADGIPFSKDRAARLEKDGVTRKFKTQEELDWAWANGWYEPGRPETADEVTEQVQWPDKETIKAMSVDELKAFVKERKIPDVHHRWGYARLQKYIIEFIDYPE